MEFKRILTQFLLVILEIFIFLIIAIIVIVLIYGLGTLVLGDFQDNQTFGMNPYQELVANFLPQTIGVLAAIYFVKVIAYKIPEVSLGFTDFGLIKDSLKGWGYGFLLVGVGFIILYLFRQIEVIGIDINLSYFFGFILLFIVQSFSEEVVFRSFMIPMIQYRLGTMAALLISSFLFFIVHLMNPNASWLGMVNLVFGGILMGLLFLKYKNVWAPTGFHASWNFVQSAFLGFPVSGHETYSLLELEETGHDYISGGAFGYEGSIVSIIILILSIIYILKKDKALYHSLFEPVHHTA